MRALAIFAVFALSGCETLTPEMMFDAVKIRDDQCGSAQIQGNLDVGGTFGFFGSTVVVNINKEKKTYIDEAGNSQPCQ